jgi:hypothetical protein
MSECQSRGEMRASLKKTAKRLYVAGLQVIPFVSVFPGAVGPSLEELFPASAAKCQAAQNYGQRCLFRQPPAARAGGEQSIASGEQSARSLNQ